MTHAIIGPNAAIPLRYANRHGLVTGPTGTGKSVTIMTLAESLAKAGVSVFLSDVKGDLAALARETPAKFYEAGVNLRVPIWALGSDILARALQITDTQAGCLEIGFAYADSQGLPLDTVSDLRALLAAMLDNRDVIAREIGHVTPASIGVIQRALLRLDGPMFNAPAFDVASLLEPGTLSILKAERLIHTPRLYGALMLYILRDLSRRLPEAGDLDAPKLAFIFDEAHTLFTDSTPALVQEVESVVRLIRSKGVGIYFASQSPDDIPPIVRAQCATTVAHSRALGVGRALFQTLDASGNATTPREMRPNLPAAALGPLSADEIARLVDLTPAAPAPEDAPDCPPPTDMTWHGYAFLAFAAFAFGLVTWGAYAALAEYGLGGVMAIIVGGFLAIRKRLAAV